MDRWYAEFKLLNDIRAARSSYVCRIRDNSNLDAVEEERSLSDEAREAGVMRDVVVCMGWYAWEKTASPRPSPIIRSAW